MCRLLGFASPTPTTVSELLGEPATHDWQKLGRLHRDGWGIAHSQAGSIQGIRSAHDGTHDPALTTALHDTATTSFIAHLRLATEGMSNMTANSHPFIANGIALAHNGSVHPVNGLRDLIHARRLEPIVDKIGGTTDSALVFALVLKELDRGESLLDAVTITVDYLRSHFGSPGLNLLVVDGQQLVVSHANESSPIPYEDFEVSGLGPDLPRDHYEGYYEMWWKRSASGAVIVSSSGLARNGWNPIPQGIVASVNTSTCEVISRELQTARAA